jgi:hypothetical protein
MGGVWRNNGSLVCPFSNSIPCLFGSTQIRGNQGLFSQIPIDRITPGETCPGVAQVPPDPEEISPEYPPPTRPSAPSPATSPRPACQGGGAPLCCALRAEARLGGVRGLVGNFESGSAWAWRNGVRVRRRCGARVVGWTTTTHTAQGTGAARGRRGGVNALLLLLPLLFFFQLGQGGLRLSTAGAWGVGVKKKTRSGVCYCRCSRDAINN